jgi:hypothetical protein
MKGESSDYFEIYDELQTAGRLRMLLVRKASNTDGGTHIGRALVWVGENPSDSYIDRIYCPTSPTSSDPHPMVIQAIADFCKAEGIEKTVFDQTARVIPWLTKTTLRVKCSFYFDHYPYVDSLRYLYDDGWLSTSSSRGYNCRILDQTDGRYNGEDEEDEENMIYCACGNYYPEDETRHSDSRDEHYHNDDVSWVQSSSDYIPDDDIININNEPYDRERDDVVVLYNGDYALLDDVVELHDGEYALTEDTVKLHDGDYALTKDTVELHNGDYAFHDDVVTLSDGSFALAEDATENEDGTWSLSPES